MSKNGYKEVYLGNISQRWEQWGRVCNEKGTTRSAEIRKLMMVQLGKNLCVIFIVAAAMIMYSAIKKDIPNIWATPSIGTLDKY